MSTIEEQEALKKRKEDAAERHQAASHAMQSGVAMKMNYDGAETQPKHLRVGINVALRDHASLVKLLIERHVIKEEDYLEFLADGMEEEAESYEKYLREKTGGNITLG